MPNPEWHTIAIPIITSSFSAFVGYKFGLRRSRQDRLHGFRQSMSVLLVKLKDSSDEFGFYKESRDVVLAECVKIEADISKANLLGFRSARASYFEMGEREVQDGLDRFFHRLTHGTHTQSGEPIPYPRESDQRPRKQKMFSALQELKHYGS